MKPANAPNDRLVGWWLLTLALWVVLIAIVGGLTRQFDAGLSIVRWEPLSGILPPLSETAWNEAFSLYKQIPEYNAIHSQMTLDGFKVIYAWEWAHRLVARSFGLVFLLPFAAFAYQKRLARMRLHLLLIVLLSGTQAAVGWWMVKSGLNERIDVSPLRLATHLGIAALIFALAVHGAYTCLANAPPNPRSKAKRKTHLFSTALALLALTFLQMILGAFVAGTDGGLVLNSWPGMQGAVRSGALKFWNLYEVASEPAIAQFWHRSCAYLLCATACLHALRARRRATASSPFDLLLIVAIFFQTLLGIATLIAVTPPDLATFHQAFAFVILGLGVVCAAKANRARLSLSRSAELRQNPGAYDYA